MVALSRGAVDQISQGAEGLKAVLQVTDVSRIAGNTERYRLFVSDGLHSVPAMLSTQLNQLAQAGKITTGTIFETIQYMTTDARTAGPHPKKVVVLLDVKVMLVGAGLIGNPTEWVGESQTYQPPQQPQRSPQSAASTFQQPPPYRSSTNYTPQRQQPQQSFADQDNNSNYSLNTNRPSFTSPSSASSMNAPMEAGIVPINNLNPYQTRWTVKARVTQKGPIKNWQNAKGTGKLFSITLLDAQGGEIRATLFHDAVDKYYPMIQEEDVYLFSRGTVKPANKRFSTLKHNFELTFDNNSEIEPIQGPTSIPQCQYDFRPIASISQIPKDESIDVIGIVAEIGAMTSITTRNQTQLNKRNVTIADTSNASIQISLWGERAESFTVQGNPVIALKNVKVSEWDGRSLSTLADSQVRLNPPIPETQQLQRWWAQSGANSSLTSLTVQRGESGAPRETPRRGLAEIKADAPADRQAYSEFLGRIKQVRSDPPPWYVACPTCSKKLAEDGAGQYYCDKCQQNQPTCELRYILNMNVVDDSGSVWLTCFNDVANNIVGKTAGEMDALRQANPEAFEQVFKDVASQLFKFRVRTKTESFNDQTRAKCVALAAEAVDQVDEGKRFLAEIYSHLSVA